MYTIDKYNIELKSRVGIHKITNIFMKLKNGCQVYMKKNQILVAHLENHRCFVHSSTLNIGG